MNAVTGVACEAEIKADADVLIATGVTELSAAVQAHFAWVEAVYDAYEIWAEEERLGL